MLDTSNLVDVVLDHNPTQHYMQQDMYYHPILANTVIHGHQSPFQVSAMLYRCSDRHKKCQVDKAHPPVKYIKLFRYGFCIQLINHTVKFARAGTACSATCAIRCL